MGHNVNDSGIGQRFSMYIVRQLSPGNTERQFRGDFIEQHGTGNQLHICRDEAGNQVRIVGEDARVARSGEQCHRGTRLIDVRAGQYQRAASEQDDQGSGHAHQSPAPQDASYSLGGYGIPRVVGTQPASLPAAGPWCGGSARGRSPAGRAPSSRQSLKVPSRERCSEY